VLRPRRQQHVLGLRVRSEWLTNAVQ